jgi:hypothetical protein
MAVCWIIGIIINGININELEAGFHYAGEIKKIYDRQIWDG